MGSDDGVAGRPMSRRALRALGLVAVAVAVFIASTTIGWRLAGPDSVETSIGRVSFTIVPALDGRVRAFVPVADWGLQAEALDAPIEIRAELRSLDRRALTRAADGDRSILAMAEDELQAGARSAVIRAVAWGLAAEVVLVTVAVLLWRPRPWRGLVLATVAVTSVGLAAGLWSASATFDARAFDSPTYFARGAELRRILEVAEDTRVGSAYGSTFASILRSISAVLVEDAPAEPGSTELYLASDLHANPVVIDPLARSIGDAPLLFAGDYGQRGGAAESALLAPRVAALSPRVVAVSGNHDTRRLMEALAADGVTVLGDRQVPPSPGSADGRTAEVEGLRVAGFSDPFEWPGADDPDDRPITFDDLPDPGAAFAAEVRRLARAVERLPESPDVVMLHQSGLARALAAALADRDYEPPLTIVTGHDHRQRIDRYGEIIVVDAGTVGAGGAFEAGRTPIGFAQLHFDPRTSRLRSVDLLEIEPFSGRAQASRIIIREVCPEADRCSVEPVRVEPEALE